MQKISADEVEMTFESSGMPPIVQELVQRVYLPPGNNLLYHRGIWREFVLVTKLKELNAQGIGLYKDDTVVKAAIKNMQSLDARLRLEIHNFLKLERPQWQDLTLLFKSAESYIAQYSTFDVWYTDGAFPHANDPKVAAALEAALKEKNVIREVFTQLFFEPGKTFQAALEHAARTLGIQAQDAAWYFVDDLKRAYEGELLTDEVLSLRRIAYVSYKNLEGEFERLEGDAAEKYIAEFDTSMSRNVTELRGTGVSKGAKIVKGTVRVIASDYINFANTQSAMDAMSKGDILVSPTTAPDLMPALKKAAAIITDVGGMLSHAAIVSRELGTPCIVGVRNASKILKDGDIVEVDADNGIVRKL